MAKELVVSSNNHETKVALLEDNQVVEVYFEREKEYSLAGSIYKGRVTRVLPGMQSAFVDVGLERDAFLYVSDFFEEDAEEYDRIVSTVEEKVAKMEDRLAETTSEAAAIVPEQAPAIPPAAPRPETREPVRTERTGPPGEHRRPFSRRSRHRRPKHKGFPESKYARQAPPESRPEEPESPAPVVTPTILPGESLAKYKHVAIVPADLSEEAQPESPQSKEHAAEMPSAEAVELSPSARESLAPEVEAGEEAAAEPSKLSDESWESAEQMHEAAPGIEPLPAEREPDTAEQQVLDSRPSVDTVGVPSGHLTVDERSRSEAEWSRSPAGIEPVDRSVRDEFSAQEMQEAEQDEETPAEPVLAAEPSWSGSLTIEESSAAAAPEDMSMPQAGEAEAPAETEMTAEVADEAAAQESSGEAVAETREAAVRQGQRNPRYQRKARWMARREQRSEQQRPEARREAGPRTPVLPKPQIADLLKEGKEIIVQIAKEPLGKKGARITSHIALPGRYLVYMPTVAHVGVSHKIASEEERHRLKRIMAERTKNLPGGFIVRTAGEGHSEQELQQDVSFLSNLWADIKGHAEKAKAPALLHHDLDVIERILRDQLSADFDTVWVDNEAVYEKIVNWVSRFQPSLVGRIKLYMKEAPLFEAMGIQEELNKALKSKVWLKSGGYIVINQTEALVAIDVNTGKFVGKSNRLEDTIVKTNVDAIQEIVRQIRLRDLGGILVVDFIDMDERKNRQRVMAALEEAIKSDRAPCKILAFNEFGLVAITRKRVRQSLERALGQPCPYCSASGYVKSVASVCCEIFTDARRMAREFQGKQVTLRVHPEVGKALKARDNTILSEIEELTGKPVLVRNDPALHIESFSFE